MTPSQNLFAHWYFHIPNLILAALTYATVARGILSAVLREERLIMRVFNGVTNPVLSVVGAITPRIVPFGLLIVFAVVWLLVARIALFFAFAILGIRTS
jgi:hypothetical protein